MSRACWDEEMRWLLDERLSIREPLSVCGSFVCEASLSTASASPVACAPTSTATATISSSGQKTYDWRREFQTYTSTSSSENSSVHEAPSSKSR